MTKHRTVLATASLAGLLAVFAPALLSRADIFQWEYINPANPGLGKQQSTMLAPDGAGANAVPGATLSYRNLTKAYLSGAPLGAYHDYWYGYSYPSDLTGTNLSQADLTNASFYGAILTDADLTGAEVRGTNFNRYYSGETGGITAVQLYSTASYQARDLSAIGLSGYNLAGINLVGQNLSNSGLSYTTFTNSNFSQSNLTSAYLGAATLTGAIFTGADVREAIFDRDYLYGGTGITAAQLYSTASYEANELTGIHLDRNDLSSANLANQNLTRASFYGATLSNASFHQAKLTSASFTYPLGSFPFNHVATNLSGANLSLADLTDARFGGGEVCQGEFCWPFEGANLSFANLSGADARGANFHYASMGGTNTENMINPNGHIAGLDLRSSEMLIVRNYVNPAFPTPIVVDQHLTLDATGTLRLVFDAAPWDSTISFVTGIPVALGGMLELTFAPGIDIASQSGRTIDLFDWTGVTPTGAFTVSSPYTWDLSNLYSTGEVTLATAPSLPGDFNHNGTVDAADYVVWRKNPGGIYTQNDFNIWRAHFGQPSGSGSVAGPNATVPEPTTLVMLIVAAAAVSTRRRWRAWPVSKLNNV